MLKEHSVYGLKRLGICYRDAQDPRKATYAYELTDHLGNVRAVVVRQGSSALALTAKTDYYPFGMPMPNKNVAGNYRYKFQGQEKDKETGKEAFELRLWDGRIGRWLTPDPAEQFFSPYLGMGDNPINAIDPDGGDIIFLFDTKAVGRMGHAAILIGNDKDGWRYLSMNGTEGEKGSAYGPNYYPDLGDTKAKKDPQGNWIGNDFRGTELTAEQVIKKVNSVNTHHEPHHYDKWVRIKTTSFEDKIAYQAAKKQASTEMYNIFGSSCIDVPQEAFSRIVQHRLNVESGKSPWYWHEKLNFSDQFKYGDHILIPNGYLNGMNQILHTVNSDLNNDFKKMRSPRYF